MDQGLSAGLRDTHVRAHDKFSDDPGYDASVGTAENQSSERFENRRVEEWAAKDHGRLWLVTKPTVFEQSIEHIWPTSVTR